MVKIKNKLVNETKNYWQGMQPIKEVLNTDSILKTGLTTNYGYKQLSFQNYLRFKLLFWKTFYRKQTTELKPCSSRFKRHSFYKI